MDIVIPLHEWSINGDQELKFTLRTFEKFLPHDDVYIIGTKKPGWANDKLKKIPYIDSNDPMYREANMYLKLKYFIDKSDIKRSFIYANDDYFLLNNWKENHFWKSTLKQTLDQKHPGDPYRKTVNNTLRLFPNGKNFDVHYPMVIDPKLFANIRPELWKEKWGYCLKTLYCELNKIEGEKTLDVKFNDPFDDTKEILKVIPTLEYFTTADKVFNEQMIKAMKYVLPEPSRYEK